MQNILTEVELKYKKEFGNGAFNIARKGIITLRRIDAWAKENKFLRAENKKGKYSPDLFVSNQEWDNFVQK